MKVGTVALLARASALAVAGCLMMPQVAWAQAASNEQQVTADIPAGALGPALESFGKQAGIAIVYPAEMVRGLSTDGVSGTMSVQVALARLLAGTGLAAQLSDGVVNLVKVGDDSGERVLGAVRVQGSQGGGLLGATVVNGVNGSRDVTATEGTGSYTSNALTVGSKTAQSIKDTPMAVSVLTSQRMQDQNITDLNSAMRDAPGVSVVNNTASNLAFFSRGFQITQLQIDGGAPQVFAGTGNNYYTPIIDMSLYDHLELVRGATGTFNGYGNPGGVLNLVRKRPLDHAQMLIEMQLGSWNWRRISADITGPIAFDGRLRARLIATNQGNDYFYGIANATRNVLSGTLELDVAPSTLLTAGANYLQQNDVPWVAGLPRYINGDAIPLSRSIALTIPSATDQRTNVELFAQIEQKIGSSWNLKLKATRIRQRGWSELPIVSGWIDPSSGAGLQVGLGTASRSRSKQTQIEAAIDGSFRLFGHDQKLVAGANYSMINPTGSEDYTSSAADGFAGKSSPDGGDIFNFDGNQWIPIGKKYQKNNGFDYADIRSINIYTNLDIVPFSRFHIITGLRYSLARSRVLQYGICTQRRVDRNQFGCQALGLGSKYYNTPGAARSGSNFSWPPSVQVKYDFTKNLTGYAGYTDIYVDRSGTVSEEGKPLPPTTGGNYEGGLKWLSSSKKLNVNFAAYYTRQINTDAIQTKFGGGPVYQNGALNNQRDCCAINDPESWNLSYGADLEVSGEIRRGWNLSASYSYNYNKSHRRFAYVIDGVVYSDPAKNFDGSYPSLESRAPKHLFKLWTTYDFSEKSSLEGLRIGFGVSARSKTYKSDIYCPGTSVIETDGSAQCDIGYKNVFFTDPGYVVFSGSLGYKFSDRLRIDGEFENLLNSHYLETVGGLAGGNWYGSPRAVKVSLRGKF